MVNNLFKIDDRKQREAAIPEASDVISHPITEYKKDQHEADVTPFRRN